MHFKVFSYNHLYCTLFLCLLSNYSNRDNENLLKFLKSVHVKIFLTLHLLRIKFLKKIW